MEDGRISDCGGPPGRGSKYVRSPYQLRRRGVASYAYGNCAMLPALRTCAVAIQNSVN